jgi:uncharacterized membrane protein
MNFEYIWDKEIGPILYVNFENRKIGLCFCHRRKDRSIWFFGLEKYFCARCLGILIGALAGFIYNWFFNFLPLLLYIALMIPLLMDGFSQLLKHRESNNGIRLITGFLFGFGITVLLLILLSKN